MTMPITIPQFEYAPEKMSWLKRDVMYCTYTYFFSPTQLAAKQRMSFIMHHILKIDMIYLIKKGITRYA